MALNSFFRKLLQFFLTGKFDLAVNFGYDLKENLDRHINSTSIFKFLITFMMINEMIMMCTIKDEVL